jgi:hypothetical protein
LTDRKLDADAVTRILGLAPHPEGGSYRETFRDRPAGGGRSAQSGIYYMLRAGEVSAWHRVRDAVEIWHYYAGAALALAVVEEGRVTRHRLGVDLAAGERPQAAVPAGAWQSAASLGNWTLVGCTVAPGFEFSGFELAPNGWEPPADEI